MLSSKKTGLKFISLILSGLLLFLLPGCGASKTYRFKNAEPVEIDRDRRPVPVPKIEKFQKGAHEYDVLFRQPVINLMDVEKIPPARDINALDEVPASSWFTPRLGFRAMAPEALVRGPEQTGPPHPPLKAVKLKNGGDGILIEDARGERYMITFDPPSHPGITTTTNFIVNRLFWGFGYNVTEDYLYCFSKDDLLALPESGLSPESLTALLEKAAPPENGRFRSTASLLPRGVNLGPILDRGLRKDDPNDRIPHEDRRVLRGLGVFSAFVNHIFICVSKTMDVYTGVPGEGHVVHYLQNFSEALGGSAVNSGYAWSGFTHTFNYKDFARNLASFGLNVRNWEVLEETPWKSVGTFDAASFDPGAWREVFPYLPIRRSRPADDYWAAKILRSLTEAHIRALVAGARYSEPEAADYMIDTLMDRRNKVMAYAFSRVSPIEMAALREDRLLMKDMACCLPGHQDTSARYDIRYFDSSGNEISAGMIIYGAAEIFQIPLSMEIKKKSKGYLRVDVCKRRAGEKVPMAAQFHFRGKDPSTFRLVGVVH